MTEFWIGFDAVRYVLLILAGGATAVVLALLVMTAVVCLCSVAFDILTGLLAKRWQRRGYVPRNRLEKIILKSAEGGTGSRGKI